jgi:hypothetical protein
MCKSTFKLVRGLPGARRAPGRIGDNIEDVETTAIELDHGAGARVRPRACPDGAQR